MSGPVLIPPGRREVVGDSPDRRVEILSDDASLNATWSRFGPGREGAGLHIHLHHTDLFYVLAGDLTVRLGVEDREVATPAGTLARVPPLVVHGFRNGSDSEEVRYLNLHAPGASFADYLRAGRDGRPFAFDQHDPPGDGVRPASEAVAAAAPDPGVGGDGFHTAQLADVKAIAVAEVRVDRRRPPTEPEARPGQVTSFFVLEGEMTVLVDGGRDLTAVAGAWVQVPAGTPHAAGFTGGGVRFLEIRTPAGG